MNKKKIKQEAWQDGHYAIVTSELDLDDSEAIRLNHDFRKIEEIFKISKSELRTRPVHVSLESYIEVHFLTCFVALVLLRTLELKLNRAGLEGAGGPQVFQSFGLPDLYRIFTCSLVPENCYTFHFTGNNIKEIEQALELELGRKHRKRGEIRSVIADAD